MDEKDKVITLGGAKHGPSQQDNQKELAAQHDIPQEFIDNEFTVPTDTVELPSRGRFYANGQTSVQIRYLTAEDENILTSPELIRNGKVLDVLLENAIVDTTLHPDEMLIGDRNAVLLALRSTGYGDDYEVKMSCPDCNEEYRTHVSLQSLEYKQLSAEPDANGEFNLMLPVTKRNIKFRLLNGRDESQLAKLSERQRKLKGGRVQVTKNLTERYILQIMEVEGMRDKGYISNFISKMPIKDSLYFREYAREIEPGVDMEHEFECKNCGHVYDDTVPITAKLFWPNAKI